MFDNLFRDMLSQAGLLGANLARFIILDIELSTEIPSSHFNWSIKCGIYLISFSDLGFYYSADVNLSYQLETNHHHHPIHLPNAPRYHSECA